MLETLLGIGPDRLSASFTQTFLIMMHSLTTAREDQLGARNGELRVATNLPSLHFLVALLKFGPQPSDPDGTGLPGKFVRPIELAKAMEQAASRAFQSEDTRRIIRKVLAIVGGQMDESQVQAALLGNREVCRPRETIKKAIMDAVPSLEELGLIETTKAERAKGAITSGVRLTRNGWLFLRELYRDSALASAKLHPAFDDNLQEGDQNGSPESPDSKADPFG